MKPDFKVLDGLRGIAATYVVISHCRGHLLMGGVEYSKIIPVNEWSIWTKFYFFILQFTPLGAEFVIFFFVLSGFSIAYSLRKKQNILKFYSRRLIRLYPPYITALIWAAFVFWIAFNLAPALTTDLKSVFYSPQYIISNLFYISKGAFIGQFWSLTHEVIFYLLIPFVIVKRKIYYAVSLVIYLCGWVFHSYGISNKNILISFLVDYNIYFSAGVWIFYNYNKVEPIFNSSKLKMATISLVLITSMLVIKYWVPDSSKITFLVSSLLSVVLIVNFLNKNITNRLIAFLGTMSYTIYISHFATMRLYETVLLKIGIIQSPVIMQFWVWPIGVLVCILFSYLIYQIAEKPTKSILDKLRS